MGCNCKSKINKKYTDGKDDGRENRTETGVFFHKILNVFFYLLVTVFAIVLVPFALIFVMYKAFKGEAPQLTIPFIDKILEKNRN